MNSVLDVPELKAYSASQRPGIAQYYQVYRDVARERGLLLIDNYPNWQKLMHEDKTAFLKLVPDGIHPQEQGYRKILLPELLKAFGVNGN